MSVTTEDWPVYESITKAIRSLERNSAWKGMRLSQMGMPVLTRMLPTAAVGVRKSAQDQTRIDFFFNPDFVRDNALTQTQIEFIISHELGHIQLGHCTRAGKRNPSRWNIAIDAVVNELLLLDPYFSTKVGELGLDKLGAIRLAMLPIPSNNKPPRSVTSEEIYDELEKQDGLMVEKIAKMVLDEHGNYSVDEDGNVVPREGTGELTEEEKDVLKAISESLKEAADESYSNGRDNSISTSKELIAADPLWVPVSIEWEKILAQFFKSHMLDEIGVSWLHPPRAIHHSYPDILLPNEEDVDKPKRLIYLYADVSGSMYGLVEKMAKIISNFTEQFADIQSTSILSNKAENVIVPHVFTTQVDVWGQDLFEQSVIPASYGGTDFECIVNHVRELEVHPSMVFVLTDGEAPVPKVDDPDRWCWLLANKGSASGVNMSTLGVGVLVDGGDFNALEKKN